MTPSRFLLALTVLTLGAPAFAQTALGGVTPPVLLERASSRALAARTWAAEGTVTTTGAPVALRIFYRLSPAPIAARLEMGGPEGFTRVCDGSIQWTYYPRVNGYVAVGINQISPCASPLNAFPPLRAMMTQARFTDGVRPGAPCYRIQGRMTFASQDSEISVCIDAKSYGILEYRQSSSRTTLSNPAERYAFSRMETDQPIDPQLLRFTPPPGARELARVDWIIPPGAIPATASPGVKTVSNETGVPGFISLGCTDPPIGPTTNILVYGEVNSPGAPHNLQVMRKGLQALDAAALACAERMNFNPSYRNDGTPYNIAVVLQIPVSNSEPGR